MLARLIDTSHHLVGCPGVCPADTPSQLLCHSGCSDAQTEGSEPAKSKHVPLNVVSFQACTFRVSCSLRLSESMLVPKLHPPTYASLSPFNSPCICSNPIYILCKQACLATPPTLAVCMLQQTSNQHMLSPERQSYCGWTSIVQASLLAAIAGKVQVLAFANFGSALRSSADLAKSSSSAVLDYSRQDLSISSEAREKVTAILLGCVWV